MNYDKIIKDFMKEEYAKQITEWNYEGEYAVYNLPSYDVCKEKKYGIVREDKKDNYIVYIIDSEVVFYLNMKPMNNKLYVGVGLNPKYCGQGRGKYFLDDSIKEIKKRYPRNVLFLEVRSWNKRAIKSYQNVGFKIVGSVTSKDRFGNYSDFVQMEMSY